MKNLVFDKKIEIGLKPPKSGNKWYELVEKTKCDLKSTFEISDEMSEKIFVIPPARIRYLSEISENNRAYDEKADLQIEVAQRLYGIFKTISSVANINSKGSERSLITKNGLDTNAILRYAQNDRGGSG